MLDGAGERTHGGCITDVDGILVGHYTDAANATGCTVVLCDPPAAAGIDVRGASPGSRETELLSPLAAAERVNGIMLAGGSAFGLDAASGAVRFLEEHGIGLRFGRAVVPLVPSAIIFDLGMITHRVRPTADDGYVACKTASKDFDLGSVGAGTGATVGKLRGRGRAVKGGLGSAAVSLGGGVVVGALVVANPVGGIVDPDTGRLVAGPRRARPSEGDLFEDSVSILIEDPPKLRSLFANTVIGVIATNARLDKRGATRLASAGQDAIAMAVRPAHLADDGDTIFALATSAHEAAVHEDRLRAAAMRATTDAILSAVREATGLGGVPAVRELER